MKLFFRRHFWHLTEQNIKSTNSLDDGVLHDPLLALFAAARWHAGAGVPPGGLAELEVHAHPQVFEQSVEHLQHRGTCTHTQRGDESSYRGQDGWTQNQENDPWEPRRNFIWYMFYRFSPFLHFNHSIFTDLNTDSITYMYFSSVCSGSACLL